MSKHRPPGPTTHELPNFAIILKWGDPAEFLEHVSS
jgi:hypothetical protein